MASNPSAALRPPGGRVDAAWVLRQLEAGRKESFRFTDPLSDADFTTQHDPLVSPANWDMGHIAWFEELWLVHALDGPDAMEAHMDDRWVAAEHERYERVELELPDRAGCIRMLRDGRAKTAARLETIRQPSDDPLLEDWFVHHMIINHERQHQENMLMALQFVPDARYTAPRLEEKPAVPTTPPSGMVRVPGGPFPLGAPRSAGTYDNEWPRHEVDVAAFDIDVAPVTNGAFLRFIEAGGYREPTHWPGDSFDFFGGIGVDHPLHWSRNDAGDWFLREFDRTVPLDPTLPVEHVSWEEASAYAAWAGKRLPTEAEWEKAATWDPATRTKRAYPWGDAWQPDRANLGARLFGPAPVGAYPRGVSPVGCHQMVGDVWEWTATDFDAYPGFEAFPYPEYSVPFFRAGYKVLRGGSWATHPGIARGTFRNWFYSHMRHVFAGFRCARDAEAPAA